MSKHRRAPEEERRRELIEATLECIAEEGIQATSLRSVAARAGVTNGLIRHHFENKANLIVAAYRRATEMIAGPGLALLRAGEGPPRQRLANLVRTLLDADDADYRLLALWATFISQSPVDPMIAAVRAESYEALHRETEMLVTQIFAAEGRPVTAQEIEETTLEIHAVLDGFWIAACIEADRSRGDALSTLALRTIGKILQIDLTV